MSDASIRVSLLVCFVCTSGAVAQQTIFNVPSGDVLGRGKVYFETDVTYNPVANAATFTPRIVVGLGHSLEVGLNVNGLAAPGPVQTTPTPTIKCKAYDGGDNGWAFLVGDDLFAPAQNRTYDVGNYVYAQFTKTWKTKTRATFGVFNFTRNVVASGNRAGGQSAIEHSITDRVTLAADWFTGNHALGFVTPGVIIKITPRITWYGTYQIGNTRVSHGNHQLLMEIGWNFN